jgi:propanol-preferring alcohol dehydrogenase
MKAMVLIADHQSLQYFNVAQPTPGVHQILIRVAACGVCRTDLHVIDGELPNPKLPLYSWTRSRRPSRSMRRKCNDI